MDFPLSRRASKNEPDIHHSITSTLNASPDKSQSDFLVKPPILQLPKGGGSIRGMGEKFASNSFTGSAGISVPISIPAGRSGFKPDITLSYSSGAGNSLFGMGWSVALPSVTRKTEKELPRYLDSINSDTFVLGGAEDLVPKTGVGASVDNVFDEDGNRYVVMRYRPRIDQSFSLIEKWTRYDGDVHWRTITRENITTIYGRNISGKDVNTRIAHPDYPDRVFSWLICEMRDGRGNLIRFEYKREDQSGKEANSADLFPDNGNVHIKSILYCNREPDTYGEKKTADHHWYFRVIFDYGEHDPAAPGLDAVQPWNYREDTYATFRAGFCLRTRRRISRVLCFSHFPMYTDSTGVTHPAEEGGTPFLACSTNFSFTPYSDATPYALIRSISKHGYVRKPDGSYLHEQMPPIEFEYSIPKVKQTLDGVPPSALENFPEGLANNRYQLIDLNGVGLSGLLYEQGEHWYFKEGLGEKGFGKMQSLMRKPSFGNLQLHQLQDVDGMGLPSLVSFEEPLAGFYGRTEDGGWQPFRTFESIPNIDWNDPNLQFIDLNGDGFSDLLISGEKLFTWYPSLGEKGFGEPRFWPKPLEGSTASLLVFADTDNSMFMGDMSGDGLLDLVRIRQGEVTYFPALGYSKFGRARHIDKAPMFDVKSRFNPEKVILADLNGDGCADLLYTGGECSYWLNLSGNRFGSRQVIAAFPKASNGTRVQLADLKSTGTACLVWSSSLPGDERFPIKYVELMESEVRSWSVAAKRFVIEKKIVKPFLLTAMENGLGGRIEVEYKPSTAYYLDDLAAGVPWQTRLPMPVQVVSASKTVDLVTSSVYTTRYAYHHGYFNHEREFCGFGCVDQWDTDDFNSNQDLDQQTVQTRTWYHTGANPSAVRLEDYFRTNEYYHGDNAAWYLPDTDFENTIGGNEVREAARVLKGNILHQEIYAIEVDAVTKLRTTRSQQPYTVTEKNYRVVKKQEKGTNRYAVYSLQALETITYKYEQDTGARKDPRVSHEVNLGFDEFNNVLATSTVSYPRRANFQVGTYDKEQNTLRVVYSLSSFTKKTSPDTDYITRGSHPGYRHSVLYENQQWEYCNQDTANFPLQASSLQAPDRIPGIEFFENAGNLLCKRLIAHSRHRFYDNDGNPLGLGVVDFLALPFESYRLAFTQEMLENALGPHYDTALKADLANSNSGGYRIDGVNYWRSSGYQQFGVNNFYHTTAFFDPFGNKTTVDKYWHNILAIKVSDAAGNTTEINSIDPYSLQPKKMTDPNSNTDEIAFDVLGQVAGNARYGVQYDAATDSYQAHGFALANFNPYLTLSSDAAQPAGEIDDLINNDPLGDKVVNYLQQTGSRYFVDYWRFKREGKPVAILAAVREDFASDSALTTLDKIRTTLSYQDGLGRTIVTKLHVEPGIAFTLDNAGKPLKVNTVANPGSARWLATGLSIFNNKGKQVQQFENYHCINHQWAPDDEIKWGVSNSLYYDPVGRLERVKFADGTLTRTTFGPWSQREYDQNDTVLESGCTWYSDRGSPNPADPAIGQSVNQPLRAAWLATQHAGTPKETSFDNLGRSFDVIENNGAGRLLSTRTHLDIAGNARSIMNAMQFTAIESWFNYLGESLRNHSFDSGDRREVRNGAGNPYLSWDGKGTRFGIRYDKMQRPLSRWVKENGKNEKCVSYTVYGDRPGVIAATDKNIRGVASLVLDQSGASEMVAMDVQGKPLVFRRQLIKFTTGLQYNIANAGIDILPDWSQAAATDLNASTSIAAIRAIIIAAVDAEVYQTISSCNAIGENVQSDYSYFKSTAPGNIIDVGRQANTFNSRGLVIAVSSFDFKGKVNKLVGKIQYDEKGQRSSITYGNGVVSSYTYDARSYRLINLTSKSGGVMFQNLSYSYDAVGNITSIADAAQDDVYFSNRRVEPSSNYAYDALYRLTFASGREHLGLAAGALNPAKAPEPFDGLRTSLPHPGDGNALGRYYERYTYDDGGNMTLLEHFPENQVVPVWSREYHYEDQSSLNPAHLSNRLTYTMVGNRRDDYRHDVNGNMSVIPHLQMISWNALDQLQATATQAVNAGVPETTYYQYDATGQRVRKITFNQQVDPVQIPTVKEETIYTGPFEIYRRYAGAVEAMRRLTCHVMDDKTLVAMVETKTLGNNNNDGPLDQPMIRYQMGNHLGSVSVELDDNGKLISYEEYFPYGETSYQAVDQAVQVVAKRYRYVGKERDNESSLYYYGARYFLPWLGRWCSADPLGLRAGPNLYSSVDNNPIKLLDTTGLEGMPFEQQSNFGLRMDFDLENGIISPPYINLNKTGYAPDTIGTEWFDDSDVTYRTSVGVLDVPPSAAEPPERSFWSRGGGTLGAGLLSIGAAIFILSNPVGWIAGLVAGLALSGGIVGTTVGGVQLGLSYGGVTSAEEDAAIGRATGTAMSLASIGGMAGAVGGGLVQGEEGVYTGAKYGSMTEAGVGLAYGAGKLALSSRWLYEPAKLADEGLQLGRAPVLEGVTSPRATVLAEFTDVVESGGGSVNWTTYSLGNVERAAGPITSHLEGVFTGTRGVGVSPASLGGAGLISREETRFLLQEPWLLQKAVFRYKGLRVPSAVPRLLNWTFEKLHGPLQ